MSHRYLGSGPAGIEFAGRMDIADGYRRVSDLAVAAAASYAAGVPDVECRERIDAALEQVDRRMSQLAVARSGYARVQLALQRRRAAS